MRMFGAFRKTEADDPDLFLANAVIVLAAYPAEVIERVADPVKGIAGEQTFVPSMAELKACCDKHYAPILDHERRERFNAEQFAKREERRREEREREERADSVKRVAEHWETVRRGMALKADAGGPPIEKPPEALARATGLSIEEVAAKLAAIPDAPMTEARRAWLAKGGDLKGAAPVRGEPLPPLSASLQAKTLYELALLEMGYSLEDVRMGLPDQGHRPFMPTDRYSDEARERAVAAYRRHYQDAPRFGDGRRYYTAARGWVEDGKTAGRMLDTPERRDRKAGDKGGTPRG